jgi:hypothetical protein
MLSFFSLIFDATLKNLNWQEQIQSSVGVTCVPKQSNCAPVARKINHFAQDLISRRNKQAARKIYCCLARVVFPQNKSTSKQIGSRVSKFANNGN